MATKLKALSLAEELKEIMAQKAEIEAELAPLKEREEEIRADLAKDLIQKGLQYVKLPDGSGFGLNRGRMSYGVKEGMENEALEWAIKQYPAALSISKSVLGKIVGPMLTPPEFVEQKQGEAFLTYRKADEEV